MPTNSRITLVRLPHLRTNAKAAALELDRGVGQEVLSKGEFRPSRIRLLIVSLKGLDT